MSKKITKIPDIDSYVYSRLNFNKFLFSLYSSEFKIEEDFLSQVKNFQDLKNIFFDLNRNNSKYSFGLKKLTGKYLFVEKKGFRIRTNATVLSIVNKKDFSNYFNIGFSKFLNSRFLEEFEILKRFKNLNSEFAFLSNTKRNHLLIKQKILQLNRLNIILKLEPKKLTNNKGLWFSDKEGFFFTPYSKTPQNLKNKNFKNYLYPLKLKEAFFEPVPKKGFRSYMLFDIKKYIWLIQSRNFKRNLKFLASIYTYRYPYAFLVGVDGVPVLLHRNQLFLSCRQMKKAKNLFQFNNYIFVKIFARYKSEKRTNIIIDKKIFLGSKKNLSLKFKYFNSILRRSNFYKNNKNLFKKK